MKLKSIYGLTIFFLFFSVSCATTKKGYSDVNEKILVGSRWSDTDNQEVAREIVKKALLSHWLDRVKSGPPKVGVGRVRNMTSEEIDTTALVNFMQDELINSGKVTFVANDESTRQAIDAELARQETYTKSSERSEVGQQSGIQYLFQGDINSKTEQDEDLKVINYQVNFKLINLQSTQIEWSGQHRVRKKFER
ncbi:hypothetical protein EBU99_13555 [bacterium]|nr:hypothetical protein [bacterium]